MPQEIRGDKLGYFCKWFEQVEQVPSRILCRYNPKNNWRMFALSTGEYRFDM